MQQILIIANWIEQYDPSKVDDCFSEQQFQFSDEFKELESNLQNDLKNIDRMQLSPNNQVMNDQVKKKAVQLKKQGTARDLLIDKSRNNN